MRSDKDPTETQEWLESLDSVMGEEGPGARGLPAGASGRASEP
jgi:pyruvate dehydrogenase complex dehydrogenase (E1) component